MPEQKKTKGNRERERERERELLLFERFIEVSGIPVFYLWLCLILKILTTST